eukprot:6488949-Amphidinium_carterae.1
MPTKACNTNAGNCDLPSEQSQGKKGTYSNQIEVAYAKTDRTQLRRHTVATEMITIAISNQSCNCNV